ncbi:von Willebrand factor A domain-containing protein 8-like [Sinocyclocheilus grahami]|uniref:von Willebrand factor A domain-containing protein 8-like n=1 Tax=Sinocyclocheilus grahami TaxID=75366 RepID=UPI0007AD32DC|nr:PREDICTED: von Willebrand factor A domain-containing protein 8-like [Sinocyclocheilus grahami]
MTAAYLEVTDLNSKKLKYIPVPRSSSMSPYTVWISKVSDTDVVMAPLGSGGVVTVDIRLWKTGLDNLQLSAGVEEHDRIRRWRANPGGRDSAGLGGKGGPYRLDAGHKVYQISQAEKDAVPDELKRAAREMAEKAFKQRLKEIEMNEYDATTYKRYSGAVRRQVQSLRIILESLQAKGKERQWLRNQALGELDDAKIIDGLTGEKGF